MGEIWWILKEAHGHFLAIWPHVCHTLGLFGENETSLT